MQSETCSMINWETGKPNAHYWAPKLIADHFGPGDQLVATESSSADVAAQGALTHSGRKLLLVNTGSQAVSVSLHDALAGSPLLTETVDEASGEEAPRSGHSSDGLIQLAPFAVAVVSKE